MAIWKGSGQSWNDSDIREIEKTFQSLEKMVENHLEEGVKCKCNVRRKTPENGSQPLTFKIEALSTNAKQQLNIFDTEKFMSFLNFSLDQQNVSTRAKSKIESFLFFLFTIYY